MIIAVLVVLGLCFGSFVNALVWRVHEQADEAGKKHPSKKHIQNLSIAKGRSMCPHCKHQLSTLDLLPVLSWITLKGKCRYCKKPIDVQYPLVELSTAVLFVASYIWWPEPFDAAQTATFGLWLILLVGLMALAVYDLRWMLLPNRILTPLTIIAAFIAFIQVANAMHPLDALINVILAVAVGGGIFYILFQISGGKWIGGGDVKLGWMLGLVAATPARAMLMIFLAALLGCVVSIPLLATAKAKKTTVIPFGPFLIAAIIIVQLFGHDVLLWYQQTLLGVGV